jgi:hypothetical protein
MKKLLAIIAAMLAIINVAYAYDFESGGIYYNILLDNSVEVTYQKYKEETPSYAGELIIPESVKYSDTEYKVTKIGFVAFYSCTSLTSIEIPESVTEIGMGAFLGCVELTNIGLPLSLSKIDDWAFAECNSLMNIKLPESITTIGESAFQECKSLASIEIPKLVNEISKQTFYLCISLSSIELPSSLLSIDEFAFYDCSSLTSVEIPSSVTSIENDAFSGCKSLTSIDLPSSLTSIDDYAFYGCSSLTRIELPTSVTSIGDAAFSRCYSLKTVTSLNPEPPTLGESVFYECPIETVYVPSEAIEAYQAADGWKEFNIQDVATKDIPSNFEVDGIYYKVTSVANKTLEVTSGYTNCSGAVVIPEKVTYSNMEFSVTSIGGWLFCNCKSLTNIELPSSLTSIGDGAFYGCSSLESIKLPTSVTSIGFGVFSGCKSLTSIDLPSSLKTIGGDAFEGCSSLTSIELPSSLTSIGEYTFLECSSLTSIGLPPTLTSIGDWAFKLCTSLETIKLPASVASISSGAFIYCTSLKTVTSLNPEPPTLGEYVFLECPIEAVYVPTEAVSAYKSAEGWSEFNIVGMSNVGDEAVPVYVVSDIVEEEGTVQEAREEVSFNFVEYSEVATGQGTATLTREGSSEVVNLPAAQIAGEATQARALRVVAADGKDYQVVQPLGNAATADGIYTIHFPEGYFLLGTQKENSPAFTMSFTVGDVSSITDAIINSADAEYYTLQGVKVQGKPAPGIYICRQGNKATKVVVK